VTASCCLAVLLASAATPPRYHATELGTLGGSDPVGTAALALNNKGHVVGSSSAKSAVHAFFWSDGELMDIGASAPHSETVALGVNIHNKVVGELRDPDFRSRAFFWQNGKPRLLTPLEGYNRPEARQINASGTIVGHSWNFNLGDDRCIQQPTVWVPTSTDPIQYRATNIDLPGTTGCGIAWDITTTGGHRDVQR
jgi:probable HAF family extracellular repeat protein